MVARTNPEVRRAIELQAVRDPAMGAVRIGRLIEILVEAKNLTGPVPKTRAITDIIRKARQTPAGELLKHQEVTWPESFAEGGLLPWSAAAVYPELMRQLAGRRPLFPLMNWYWKMTQMIPDATPDVRWRVAADLATWEIVQPTREGRKRLELFLLWSPWRSRKASEAYEATVPEADRYSPHTPSWQISKNQFLAGLLFEIEEIRRGVLDLGERSWLTGVHEEDVLRAALNKLDEKEIAPEEADDGPQG